MAKDDDVLSDAREAFEAAVDAENDNRAVAEEDLRFARLGEQWPQSIVEQRQRAARPCLTRNKMPAFIRQVVNDARQNKPQIKVRPVDGGADIATANVISGLIRHIEQASSADVAYDTAADFAVTMGWGYIRVDVAYAHNESFGKEIRIERVANPFAVYGDPYSSAADSADWNTAFETEQMTRAEFERRFKGKDLIDWDDGAWGDAGSPWLDGDSVLLASWWQREEVEETLLLLNNGVTIRQSLWEKPEQQAMAAAQGVVPIKDRPMLTHKITQRLMSGAQILEESAWHGEYIPIIPVYGDEVNIKGERHFLSLIHHAKDAQREYNYTHTTATELSGLQPRVPFIGHKGAFDLDPKKWETINTDHHAYVEVPAHLPIPQRQPFVDNGIAAAMRQGLGANDDMKSIIGIYDASLGARSNETSGVAIRQRQREGDVSTFHFIDNLSRAIRHTGRVVIDLIPHVYGGARTVRVLGEDGTAETAQVGQRQPGPEPGTWAVYDLGLGTYDLAVEAGPSYTTRRQESAEQMMELLRVLPASAPLIGDLLVKSLDWPHAEEIAERLRAMLPAQLQSGDDPRLAQAAEIIKQLQAQLAQTGAKLEDKAAENFIKSYEAETKRIAAAGKIVADMQRGDAAIEAQRMDAAVRGPLEGQPLQ